jgi:hypothetical protein
MAEQSPKPVSWGIYAKATVLTIAAFLAGILFAYFGLEWRVSMVENSTMDLFITMMSYQQVLQFTDPCDNNAYVWYLGGELDRIGKRLSQGRYPDYLLKQYALMESMHMQLIERMRNECNADVHWIVFFYGEGCPDCDAQGNILSYMKGEYPTKVYVYAMRYDLDSPIVAALRIEYNVSVIPTLIVDGEKYEGIVGVDELKEIMGLSRTPSGKSEQEAQPKD